MESSSLDSESTFSEKLRSLIFESVFLDKITITDIESCIFIDSETYILIKTILKGKVSLQYTEELSILRKKVEEICVSSKVAIDEIWNIEIGFICNDKLPKINLFNKEGKEYIINETITEDKIDINWFGRNNNLN